MDLFFFFFFSIIQDGCHILVATPDRLKHFCDKSYVTFDNLRYLVLDEADLLLREKDTLGTTVKDIILKVSSMPKPGKRQTLMFSATFHDDIQLEAGKYLHGNLSLPIDILFEIERKNSLVFLIHIFFH